MSSQRHFDDYYDSVVKQYEGTLGLIEDVAELEMAVDAKTSDADQSRSRRRLAEFCSTCNARLHDGYGRSPTSFSKPNHAPPSSETFCQCCAAHKMNANVGNMADSQQMNAATIPKLALPRSPSPIEISRSESTSRSDDVDSYRRQERVGRSEKQVSFNRDSSAVRNQLVSHYENRIKGLESDLQELQERLDSSRMLSDRFINGLAGDSHDVLLLELRKRDETIGRQRSELLSLQEAYDAVVNRPQPENGLNLKLETDNIALRQSLRDQEQTVQHLRHALEQLESMSRQNAGSLTQEIVERHEAYVRLRNQLREAEERLAEFSDSSLQRVDIIRQLKDDLARANESVQTQHSRILQLEKDAATAQQRIAELAKENEHLRARLQDEELRAHQGRNELQSRVGQLSEAYEREKNESAGARDRFARLERDAAQTQAQLEAKNRELSRVQQELNGLQRRLNEREVELGRSADAEGSLQQELSRTRLRAEQSETELSNVKRQLKTTIEELQRSETRSRELETESRRERESLNQEIAKKEADGQRLKIELAKLEDGVLRPLEQRLIEQERALQARSSEKSSLQLELDTKSEKCRQLETQLADVRSRLSDETGEKNRLKTLMADLEMELDTARHNIETKEAMVQQVRDDNEALEKQQKELTYRLTNRNDLLQRLTSEIAKLKAKFEDKIREGQQQSEALHNLQDALAATETAYEQLRLKHDDLLMSKDGAIKELQEVLTDLRTQSAKCVDQLAIAETQTARLLETNQQLNASVDEYRAQLAALDDANHKLQLEITLGQEKIRNTQKEVLARDQVIMRLQADCEELRRKHETALDEVALKDREINRQQQRQRELSNEMRNLNSSIEAYDKKLADLERFAREKDALVDDGKQEAAMLAKSLEQAKAERQRDKVVHEEEMTRLKEQTLKMQRELEDAGLTISDIKGDTAKHRQIIDSLQQELYKARQTAEQVANQMENLRRRSEKQHEMSISEKKRELERKDEIIKQTESSAMTFRQKYEQCLGHIEELKSTLELLQKQLIEARQRDAEKIEQLDAINRKLESRNADYARLQSENARYEQRVAELEREMKRSRQALEENLEQAQIEANTKEARSKAETTMLEERSRRVESELAQRLMEVNKLEYDLAEKSKELELARADLQDRAGQLRSNTQQSAQTEQKLAIVEQQLAAVQQDQSAKIQEINRLEQYNWKLNADLQSARESTESLRQELAGQKESAEKQRKELSAAKELEVSLKQQLQRFELELTAVREREKVLTDQVQQHTSTIDQLQRDLKLERAKAHEVSKMLQQTKQTVSDCERDAENRDRLAKDLHAQLHAREVEFEQLQGQFGQCRQQLAETQGRLRSVESEYATLERKFSALNVEYESSLGGLQRQLAGKTSEFETSLTSLQRQLAGKTSEFETSLTSLQRQLAGKASEFGELQRQLAVKADDCSRVNSQFKDCERRVADLLKQLQALQIAHREAEETGQSLRLELQRSQQQLHAITNENLMNEQKVNELRQAQKVLELEYAQVREQLSAAVAQNQQLQLELNSSEVKNKQIMQQYADREQELKLLRIDLAALREKSEQKDNDVQAALRELERLRQQIGSFEQLNNDLRRKLVDANQTNARLQEESEFVIRSVHKWVGEQKMANEKLSSKICDQSKALVQLQDERDRLRGDFGDSARRVRAMGSDEMGAMQRMMGQSEDLSHRRLSAVNTQSSSRSQINAMSPVNESSGRRPDSGYPHSQSTFA